MCRKRPFTTHADLFAPCLSGSLLQYVLGVDGLLNGVPARRSRCDQPPRDPVVRRGTAALRALVSRGPVYTHRLDLGRNHSRLNLLVPIQVRGERCDLRISWATVVSATRMLQLFLASITSVSFPRRWLPADSTLRLQGDQPSERLRIAVEELWCGPCHGTGAQLCPVRGALQAGAGRLGRGPAVAPRFLVRLSRAAARARGRAPP